MIDIEDLSPEELQAECEKYLGYSDHKKEHDRRMQETATQMGLSVEEFQEKMKPDAAFIEWLQHRKNRREFLSE